MPRPVLWYSLYYCSLLVSRVSRVAAGSKSAMETVETLVAHIQALTKPEDLAQLQSLLKQSQSDEALRSQAPHLAPLLAELDPSKHSLGYLYLLDTYLSSSISREQLAAFLPSIAHFLNTCSAYHIRFASDKFVSVCRCFKDQLMRQQTPIQGIIPFRSAVHKLQNSSEQLTTLHSDFLLLCLLAKCYKPSLSVLENDIFEAENPKDLFLFYYYGGMIYIGLKRFSKALECLHNVFTSPMPNLNAIAIEAYKKYILVSLIHSGQVPPFPKYTSATAQRNLKNYAQAYLDLTTVYATGKHSEIEACIQQHIEKFQSDNNLGLVKQVLSSLSKRNIQRLTQTYLTLSLQDISNSVQLNGSKEAELHVLHMIQDGEIHATINQKDGMVIFHEDPEEYKTCQMVNQMDLSIQRLMSLSKKLTAIDEHISCDPAYLTKIGRERTRYELDDFDSVPPKYL
ncbi:hypothetical protein LUZ63_012622 [Rhynchospora breviuscula]|uniref:COP9 signalosome complex subunit 3 n=1 Tax=Rhynchospora breviuscula TaxID=2022672 RepID=A0A9Q0HRL8_9POAL|nr:hypothetical protein LUZ63_012622 [Rhynchospora breviuscula]